MVIEVTSLSHAELALILKPANSVIINNDGYTIERAIHGAEEEYNDIDSWRFQKLLEFFGAQNSEASSHRVTTKEELEHVLMSPEYKVPTNIQLLEICMDKMDIPWRLKDQIAIVNARAQAKKAAQSIKAQPVTQNGEVTTRRNGETAKEVTKNGDWHLSFNSALC